MNSKLSINRWIMLVALATLFVGHDASALKFKPRSNVTQMSTKPIPGAAYAELDQVKKRIFPAYEVDFAGHALFATTPWSVFMGWRDPFDTSITFYTRKGKKICTEYYYKSAYHYDIEKVRVRLTDKDAVLAIALTVYEDESYYPNGQCTFTFYNNKHKEIATVDSDRIRLNIEKNLQKNDLLPQAAIEQVKNAFINPAALQTLRISKVTRIPAIKYF